MLESVKQINNVGQFHGQTCMPPFKLPLSKMRLLKVFEVYCDTKVHIVTADEEYFFLCI